MNSKILDGIMGLCVADALGVPVEFKSRTSLRSNPVKDLRGFGTYSQPAGTWSDDTSMTLCLAESLASRGTIDYQDIMNNFSAWLHEGRFTPGGKAFDIGRTCAKAIQRFDDGIEPRLCGGTSDFDNGNGSLMRILPLVYYLNEEYGPDFTSQEAAMDAIHHTSSLTHAHPRSMVACGIYIAVAGRLLAGVPLARAIPEAFERVRAYYGPRSAFSAAWKDYARLVDPSFASLPEGDIRSTGYVIDTLEAAIWCLMNTQSYRECVLKAVNLGEDTDTVAAVAGGLAGLAYGCGALPEEWLKGIVQRAFVEETCQRLNLALARIAVRKLCRFMPYFENATSLTVCRAAGEQTGEDIYALPYPKYDETMNEFAQAFSQSILFDPDYLDLTGELNFDSARGVGELADTADLALLRAVLTGFVRQERFCDGIWAEVLDEKLFHRLLLRMAELEGVRDCLQPA